MMQKNRPNLLEEEIYYADEFKRVRKQLNLTQRDMSLILGVSQTTIVNYESSKHVASAKAVDILYQLCEREGIPRPRFYELPEIAEQILSQRRPPPIPDQKIINIEAYNNDASEKPSATQVGELLWKYIKQGLGGLPADSHLSKARALRTTFESSASDIRVT
jgi:transcriptional regulator with XRE-family HTH domain